MVNTVTSGAIQAVFCSGQAPQLSAGHTYNDVAGINIIGSGTGATWNITTVPGIATTFDVNSMVFTDPLDTYSNTNAYDKYLLFPQRNIINGPIVPVNTTVIWINSAGQTVSWTNNTGQTVVWTNDLAST